MQTESHIKSPLVRNGGKSTMLLRDANCIELGFNDESTLVVHFVSSPREREKREEIVEMKERVREERGTVMKVNKQKK